MTSCFVRSGKFHRVISVSEPVVKLAPRPTAAQEVQAEVIKLLEATLEDVRSGEIVSVVMMVNRADGCWQERVSATLEKTKAIGQLFTTLVEWAHRDEE